MVFDAASVDFDRWLAERAGAFRQRLMRWYRHNRRDLPWRHSHDPYAIWVSEVMLQQTQVATVLPYYERFMRRFPDVKTLAAASLEEVLRFWEGLGYYRRAVQLWQAAQCLVRQHAAKIPNSFDQLTALPGVGRYTAGAILSLAYDRRVPILEANTERLYLRLLGWQLPVTEVKDRLWEFAAQLLPRRNVGQFHQAVMDLGSLVCRKEPNCSSCPVRFCCRAFAAGSASTLPLKTAGSRAVRRIDVALALFSPNKRALLLAQYADGERWAGLWDFPRLNWSEGAGDTPPEPQTVVDRFATLVQMPIRSGVHVASVRHSVTRFRITLHFYAGVVAGSSCRDVADWKGITRVCWISFPELDRLPLPSTSRRLCRLLDGYLPAESRRARK